MAEWKDGDFLVIQRLRLHAPNTEGTGLILADPWLAQWKKEKKKEE